MSQARESERLLALDVGNTHIVLGIWEGEDLIIRRKLSTGSTRTADEAGVIVSMLASEGGVPLEQLDAAAIASVAPAVGNVIAEMVRNHINLEPLFIHGEIPGFVNYYRNPRNVGADRVCGSVAGYARYGGPLLVLDFGTAITVDVVDGDGAYQGGMILPGLETSALTLKQATALLPEARLVMPDSVIARTSDDSIRVGLMRGAVHSLRGLIGDARRELGSEEAKVIATGGMASVVAPHLPEVVAVEPNLVLEGIRIIHEWSRTW